MKFTSEDLMKAMGLKVGDKIKVTYPYNVYITYELKYSKFSGLVLENDTDIELLSNIVNDEYEILPRPKRVGDLKCGDCDCRTCPIRIICLEESHISNSLYFNLELYKKDQRNNFDQEIYDLLKARLDKELLE